MPNSLDFAHALLLIRRSIMTQPSTSLTANQIDQARQHGRLLHCQGLAASYRRALKGLRPGPRKAALKAALQRTLAEIRATNARPVSARPAPVKRHTQARSSRRRLTSKHA
jgi:hypothetical protein